MDLIVSVLGNTTQNHDRTVKPVLNISEICSPPHVIHKRKQEGWSMISIRLQRCIHRTRIISITNDSSKSHGYHIQIAWLRGTSSWRSICFFRGKMEDAHKLLKIPKSECPDIWIRFPWHKWPKSWSSVWKTQSFFLSEICTVILWQDCYGKGNLRKSCWDTVGRKVSNWECLFVHREKGLFLSVYVDDIKLAGKKQNVNPMWKVLNKEVDLGEPTSFLDHEHLGCTQRQCQISKDIVDNYRTIFESRISAGGTEKLPCFKLQFHTVQQNQKSFLWMQDWGWMVLPLLTHGIWLLQFLETRIRTVSNRATCQRTNVKFVLHFTRVTKQAISESDQWFSSGSFVVCVWRQRSSDQDDHKGKKPDNETCFQNPQSCSWFDIWSNQFGLQNPNQIHWHQKPTRRHNDKGKFHTWWMESSFVFVQH